MRNRCVQGVALAVLAISNVQVGAVQAQGIAITDAVGITAAAGGLGEAALDHGFGRTGEALNEPPLLTHGLILRHDHLIVLSRENLHGWPKMFCGWICSTLQISGCQDW